MPTVHLLQVHSPEQVREIMEEAHKIANELATLGAAYPVVLSKAADLLAARIPIQPSTFDPAAPAIPALYRR